MKNLIFVCLLIVVMYVSCKKEKDTITQHDIKGMVFNNCTDSGLANVTVYLQDGQGLNLSTVSGVNGNFSFNNVQIHSSTKYNYALYILSKSGINAQTFEYCGFGGTVLGFNYNEVDVFFKPRVIPACLFYRIECNPIVITSRTDSIRYHLYQYTLHKNDIDAGYTWGGGVMAHITLGVILAVFQWGNI
jgi:hypothetical protein